MLDGSNLMRVALRIVTACIGTMLIIVSLYSCTRFQYELVQYVDADAIQGKQNEASGLVNTLRWPIRSVASIGVIVGLWLALWLANRISNSSNRVADLDEPKALKRKWFEWRRVTKQLNWLGVFVICCSTISCTYFQYAMYVPAQEDFSEGRGSGSQAMRTESWRKPVLTLFVIASAGGFLLILLRSNVRRRRTVQDL